MVIFVIAFSLAVATAFGVEWGQHKCEVWAQLRDKDL
jgi:hypothetical protein